MGRHRYQFREQMRGQDWITEWNCIPPLPDDLYIVTDQEWLRIDGQDIRVIYDWRRPGQATPSHRITDLDLMAPGYQNRFLGCRVRAVFYNGAWWYHVKDTGRFWSDWTNVRQGYDGRVINWDRRFAGRGPRAI